MYIHTHTLTHSLTNTVCKGACRALSTHVDLPEFAQHRLIALAQRHVLRGEERVIEVSEANDEKDVIVRVASQGKRANRGECRHTV